MSLPSLLHPSRKAPTLRRVLLWSGFTLVLFYAWHLGQVLMVANHASVQSHSTGTIVLLGKHSAAQQIDADFRARINRVQGLLTQSPRRAMVLSGGGQGKSEAMIAWDALQGGGEKALWRLESASNNTLENLSNTKALLVPSQQPVSVVSSRYHLARVDRLARSLGLDVELVAAEDHLPLGLESCTTLLREAAYLSMITLSGR